MNEKDQRTLAALQDAHSALLRAAREIAYARAALSLDDEVEMRRFLGHITDIVELQRCDLCARIASFRNECAPNVAEADEPAA